MPKYKVKKRSARKVSLQKKSKQLRSFAYKMGQVERGLKNPNSQISASYKSGQNKPAKRKPLFGD